MKCYKTEGSDLRFKKTTGEQVRPDFESYVWKRLESS